MKLSAIQPPQEPREIVLDFEEAGSVTMIVDPGKFDLGRQRRIRQAIKDNDNAAIADELFVAVLEWDLEDDDGDLIPLDESGVDRMQYGTVLLIASKMNEALGAPKAETPTASPPGSKTRTSRKPK
jgi:hypothetical protein